MYIHDIKHLQEIVGTSCSWCGDSYHQSCFVNSLKEEACHLGPLHDLIVPPSWIVKIPSIEQVSSSDIVHCVPLLGGHSICAYTCTYMYASKFTMCVYMY